jgi:TolA-binding protein
VAWLAASDALALEPFDGHAPVAGCSFGSGRLVNAGERVEGRCGPEAEPRARDPDAVTAEVARKDGDERPGAARAAAPARENTEEWAVLARHGHYDRAYALAARAGIEAEAKTRALDEVLLLGEASRLTGHADDARLAYQAVRLRFPKTAAAAQAAFHLGVLETRVGKRALAADFFETYLNEKPRGPLAPAALGRLIEARAALGDGAGARAAAKSYVERYPSGPHADEANKVLSIEADEGGD